MACYIYSNYFQFLKKRRRAMEEWDDDFFESLHSFFYKNNFIRTKALVLVKNLRTS